MPASLNVLLVDGDDADAGGIAQALQQTRPAVRLQRAHTVAEARLLLRQTSFDVALVDHQLPDGDSFNVLDFVEQAALPLPVVVLAPYGHEDLGIAMMKAGASDCIRKELDDRHLNALPARLREAMERQDAAQCREARIYLQDHHRLVEALHATVATVKHDINNPLAIISGNAQLLLELARVMDLNDELIKPIRDIEEASLRIATSLDRLSSLKEIMMQELMQSRETLVDLGDA